MTEPASGPPLDNEQSVLTTLLVIVLTVIVVVFVAVAIKSATAQPAPNHLPPISSFEVGSSPKV